MSDFFHEFFDNATMVSIEANEWEVVFTRDDGATGTLYHQQDCCEDVHLADINGDWEDLIDSPILLAREATEQGDSDDYESVTFTFYNFRTLKGSVDLRWVGSSNGYYSEAVDFKFVGGGFWDKVKASPGVWSPLEQVKKLGHELGWDAPKQNNYQAEQIRQAMFKYRHMLDDDQLPE